MHVEFVAGFGPVTRDDAAAGTFWADALGIAFAEVAPGYFATDDLPGVRAFARWPLAQAAQATFGRPEWPADRPVPQAWIELDVRSAQAVADAVAELRGAGHDVLVDAHDEPWGQTSARLQSPEGLLVGITYTPWMHRDT
ncbi:glyoxalase [Cellulomonas sp. JZ18]|uniref:VOC family protein n=1 Tax=Cellulomonas sp. JZ18 TaxID=2654191 RepID=UPI0012D47303|nr:glyoxalase [Cellulomonas sp. JZ18]QGQ18062.1 glyoxalase [Cellulomonas sp. JZ18]